MKIPSGPFYRVWNGNRSLFNPKKDRMERSWQQQPFSSISVRQYEQQQIALLSDRRRTLEDEVRRVQQRQLSQARREKLQRME